MQIESIYSSSFKACEVRWYVIGNEAHSTVKECPSPQNLPPDYDVSRIQVHRKLCVFSFLGYIVIESSLKNQGAGNTLNVHIFIRAEHGPA